MLFKEILMALHTSGKRIQVYSRTMVPITRSFEEWNLAIEYHDRRVVKVKSRQWDLYIYVELEEDWKEGDGHEAV